jgi:hypothetical protein
MEPKFVDECNRLRKNIEGLKQEVRIQLDHGDLKAGNCSRDVGANIMLSFRHLEDARMRLGKAIQAHGDGISIYDKNKE